MEDGSCFKESTFEAISLLVNYFVLMGLYAENSLLTQYFVRLFTEYRLLVYFVLPLSLYNTSVLTTAIIMKHSR